MRHLFDSMAEVYDGHMVRGLKYHRPNKSPTKSWHRHPDKHLNLLTSVAARAFWACASGA